MKTALVITSIANDKNKVLQEYAQTSRAFQYDFIVIGDVKSPDEFSLEGCDYYPVSRQLDLGFTLSGLLPTGHYSRKNLGYLAAIKSGSGIIVETDDDNYPLEDFWGKRDPIVAGEAYLDAGWVNVFELLGRGVIWPRGFELSKINRDTQVLSSIKTQGMYCPIQQGMADGNPDVDAIYRLTRPLPYFFDQGTEQVILGKGSICPFNSQNTTWFKEAFPLLYLPSFCSFRMTDIWRSFIAQRILGECDWGIAFHGPTVLQERNDHSLIKDFEDEISGYLGNGKIVEELYSLNLEPGPSQMTTNLFLCYEMMTSMGFIDSKELRLVKSWIDDLEGLGI